MTAPSIIGEIAKLSLERGDVLVVHTTHETSPEARARIQEITRLLFPLNRTVILGAWDHARSHQAEA